MGWEDWEERKIKQVKKFVNSSHWARVSRQIESTKLEIRWDLRENRQTGSHHKTSGYRWIKPRENECSID